MDILGGRSYFSISPCFLNLRIMCALMCTWDKFISNLFMSFKTFDFTFSLAGQWANFTMNVRVTTDFFTPTIAERTLLVGSDLTSFPLFSLCSSPDDSKSSFSLPLSPLCSLQLCLSFTLCCYSCSSSYFHLTTG